MSLQGFCEEARELTLYAENDYELYQTYAVPITRSLHRKVGRGIYDREKAIKAFLPMAVAAAKKYHKEFCSPSPAWHKVFSVPARQTCARLLLDSYSDNIEKGDL